MVANCVVVLNEIMADAGGMATNTAIVHHLLGRLEDFNEWGVCHILALVSRSALIPMTCYDSLFFALKKGVYTCNVETRKTATCDSIKDLYKYCCSGNYYKCGGYCSTNNNDKNTWSC